MSNECILLLFLFGICVTVFLTNYIPIKKHKKKCNGLLYRDFTFNCISNVRCTRCDYNEDTLFPPLKDWSDEDVKQDIRNKKRELSTKKRIEYGTK